MAFRTSHFVLSFAAFALLGLGSIRSAAAQTNTSPAAADPTQATDPVLKGPDIADRAPVKGKAGSGFGPDSIERKKAGGKHGATPLAMSAFLKAVAVLQSAPTPEATRLTPDQDSKIKSMASDFDASVKDYMAKNQAELDSLRAKLTPTDRAMLDQQLQRGGPIRLSKAGFGGKGAVARLHARQTNAAPTDSAAATADPSKDEAAKTRARLVEIYSGRPKAEDAQAKILGVLTPDQLAITDNQLADLTASESPHHRGRKAKGSKS